MPELLQPLAGGALIGLATGMLLAFNGRIAGISGIVGALLGPQTGEVGWRLAFLGGLVAGGLALALAMPEALGEASTRPLPLLAAAGLLVGFGTRLGSGCTSGHGVCGISRLSPRSIAATLTFIGSGALTVGLLRVLGVG